MKKSMPFFDIFLHRNIFFVFFHTISILFKKFNATKESDKVFPYQAPLWHYLLERPPNIFFTTRLLNGPNAYASYFYPCSSLQQNLSLCCELQLNLLQKLLSRAGKDLIFFPHNTQSCFCRRCWWAYPRQSHSQSPFLQNEKHYKYCHKQS